MGYALRTMPLIAVGIVAPVCAQPLAYDLTIVRDFDPHFLATLTVLTDVNCAGQVVGWSRLAGGPDDPNTIGFVWTEEEGFVDIGSPESPANDVMALGISEAGLIGTNAARDLAQYDFDVTRAYTHDLSSGAWTQHHVWSGCTSEIMSVSDNGWFCGLEVELNGAACGNAFFEGIPMAGNASGVATFPRISQYQTFAADVNEQGTVAGYGYLSDGFSVGAFYRAQGATPQVLPSLGGSASFGLGINKDDVVVGEAYLPGDFFSIATKWERVGGNWTAIPIDPGTGFSAAWAINDRGHIVGWTYDEASDESRATIWIDEEPFDLNDLVANPSGTLNRAAAISDNGWIVGDMTLNGGGRAQFILKPRPRVHFYGFGIHDGGVFKPLAGDKSAEGVAEAFESLSCIDVGINLRTFGWDPLFKVGQQILGTMTAASADVSPGDTMIFYVATHGSFLDLEPPEGDEVIVCQQSNAVFTSLCVERGTDEFLYVDPGDNGWLMDDELRAVFDTPAWNEVNKLFIIDSCFAGGFWGADDRGDSGDLATLPRSAIIAASAEANFSYGQWYAPYKTYLSLAIEGALEDLRDEMDIPFDRLVQEIYEERDTIVADHTNPEGQFVGILLGDHDFSGFWGMDLPATFEPFSAATPDFSMTPGAAGGSGACNPADLAQPFGLLDLADITTFIGGFVGMDPVADLADPVGLFDLADITAFVSAFTVGCP